MALGESLPSAKPQFPQLQRKVGPLTSKAAGRVLEVTGKDESPGVIGLSEQWKIAREPLPRNGLLARSEGWLEKQKQGDLAERKQLRTHKAKGGFLATQSQGPRAIPGGAREPSPGTWACPPSHHPDGPFQRRCPDILAVRRMGKSLGLGALKARVQIPPLTLASW